MVKGTKQSYTTLTLLYQWDIEERVVWKEYFHTTQHGAVWENANKKVELEES